MQALGILHHTLGSALWELLLEDAWPVPDHAGGPWQLLRQKQLQLAYADFLEWATHNHVEHSERSKWTLAKLKMMTLSSPPFMKFKAGNSMRILAWMESICARRAREVPSVHNRLRHNCLWGYNTAVTTMKNASLVLTDAEAAILDETREAALLSHASLRAEALGLGQVTWHTVPKHHYYDHCIRHASRFRLNPVYHWAFMDEYLMGKIKLIALKCSGVTREARVLERVLIGVFEDS